MLEVISLELFGEAQSRRAFLRNLALIFAGGSFVDSREAFAEEISESKLPFKISPWTGDDFTLGHKLRLGDVPASPLASERKVDVVIVGGGIAGLTAAHKLKDQDVLLLEQYDSAGGHARGGRFRGIDYSWGSAYASTEDGAANELYAELNIKPTVLSAEKNSWYWQQRWCSAGGRSANSELKDNFDKLLKQSAPVLLAVRKDANGERSAQFAELDGSLFSSVLKDYPEPFVNLVDSYCRSAFCGGINQISALAGYSLLEDLQSPVAVFYGGNSAIAKALSDSVAKAGVGRVVTGAFVWKVEMKDEGAVILYSTADGACHKIECRHVIVATSPMVAARQLAHVEDKLRAQLLMFKFGAYLVANCLMKEKVFEQSYDCFTASPEGFTDLVVAEAPYIASNQYKPEMGSVLTVYQPYSPGSPGRALMLAGDRAMFARKITEQLESLIDKFLPAMEEMVLTRWGHAIAIPGPGYFSRLNKINLMLPGLSLAHSSLAGGPYVEAAIKGGSMAAANAKKSRQRS